MYYSLPTLSSEAADGCPILMYHHLGRPPKFSRQRGLFVSAELFRRQLRELTDAGFHSASLGAIGGKPPGKRAIVTFDDGFAKTSRLALPLLAECGFTAIQFIVADRTVNRWDADLGHAPYPLMDDEQIREWLACGQEIGAHTLTHPHLTRIPLAAAKREIFESKARLEDRLQRAIVHFSYPYGDTNEAIRDLVIEAGFHTACTTVSGSHKPEDDPYRLPRWMAAHRRPVLAAWISAHLS